MAQGPKLTQLAQSLPASVPFVGPEAQERSRGRPFAARIGANENVFGPSPLAIEAMARASAEAWMYGDPESHDLRHALADFHEIAPENIMIGEGIDALLGYLVRLCAGQGDTVVTSDGAYPTFNYHVAGFGARLVTVPYTKDDREDPVALTDCAREEGARLVYLSNPDNPMGTWHGPEAIGRMINDVPDGALLILDEAYGETAPPGTMPPLDVSDRRVIRMRTFSKAYGLAGARVGYAIGHRDIIAAFNKVRNHFAMNRVSQAGALAALGDQAYLKKTLERIARSRDRIGQIAKDNGLIPIPSATNFVTVDCGRDGDFARCLLGELIARDIFVRMPFVAPQDRAIRFSCGTDADLDALARALPDALAAADQKVLSAN